MRTLVHFCFFLIISTSCFCQKLTIIGARECNEFLFVEVQFQNQLSIETISTPLSARAEQGNYLRSARIEYFDPTQKKWQWLQKDSHIHTARLEVLKPSETITDLIWSDTALLAGKPDDNVRLRVSITYRSGDRRKVLFASSDSFTLAGFKAGDFTSEHWKDEMRKICDENHDY